MDVLVVTVFASLILVAGAIIFLFKRVHEGDFEHGDRLSLLPLEDDAGPGGAPKAAGDSSKGVASGGLSGENAAAAPAESQET